MASQHRKVFGEHKVICLQSVFSVFPPHQSSGIDSTLSTQASTIQLYYTLNNMTASFPHTWYKWWVFGGGGAGGAIYKMRMLTLSQKIDSTDDRTAWERRGIFVKRTWSAESRQERLLRRDQFMVGWCSKTECELLSKTQSVWSLELCKINRLHFNKDWKYCELFMSSCKAFQISQFIL